MLFQRQQTQYCAALAGAQQPSMLSQGARQLELPLSSFREHRLLLRCRCADKYHRASTCD